MSDESKKLIKQSIFHSLSAFSYIILVVLLISNGNKLFGIDDNGILAPVGILLLLVLSVAIMGMLIFGKAILMYLDNEKKDAIKLVIYNITGLFIITIVYFGILFLIK